MTPTNILILALAVACCVKRPDIAPAPLLEGKCTDEPEKFMGGGVWSGVTRCAYKGYWWVCPTTTPASDRFCNREQPLPPETTS